MLTLQEIEDILRQADVEGFIGDGAPDDEYDSEAQEIYTLLTGATTVDGNKVMAILVAVWERFFNLGPDEMQQRLPYLRKVAQELAR